MLQEPTQFRNKTLMLLVQSIQKESLDHLTSFLNCYPVDVSDDNHNKTYYFERIMPGVNMLPDEGRGEMQQHL